MRGRLHTHLSLKRNLADDCGLTRHYGGVGSHSNWKFPIYHSERVSKKKSVFIAHATALPSPTLLTTLLQELAMHAASKRASHCMYAYRTFPSDASELPHALLGRNDGGEKGSGERLLRLLEVMECKNVGIVVFRWHGGTNLGSERWRLISCVAKEALKKGAFGRGSDSNKGK